MNLSDEDIVQPDLMVVCRDRQIHSTHVEDVPALVIEILSSSTMYHDRIRKLDFCARNGVKEVWLITPVPSLVEIFLLSGDSYLLKKGFGAGDMLSSPTFPEIRIELARVFDFPIDPEEKAGIVKEGRPAFAAT